MPEFKAFRNRQNKYAAQFLRDATYLYTVDVDKETLWKTYLGNFPEGTDPVFRSRTSHDCTNCRHYVQGLGNVVAIKNGVISTIWDFDAGNDTYQKVIDALASLVRSKAITDFYLTQFPKVGIESNVEVPEDGSPSITWNHMYAVVPSKHVNNSNDTCGTIIGRRRDVRNVFKRGLDEIPEKVVAQVLELIGCGSVYRGAEWKSNLTKFLNYIKEYKTIPDDKKEAWCWEKCLSDHESVMAIRGTVMGTLLIDLSEGKDEDASLESFGRKMDPANYKRPTADITPRMIDAAKKELEQLGYTASLPRRYAVLSDITINNTIFSNKDAAKHMATDPFAVMKSKVAVNAKVGASEEIHISKFISDVIPQTDTVEVLFENRHISNMVSLIAPKDKNSPSMFKWSNGFSWAYTGNMADSKTRDLVKAAGGDINGVMRFSIRWNDDGKNDNDFDAHCIEPTRNEIYYGSKGHRHVSSGMLDVDIIVPSVDSPNKAAVENIVWNDIRKMPEGVYKFFVRNFTNRGGRSGFFAEVEVDGKLYQFEYGKSLKDSEDVYVAEVSYSKAKGFEVKSLIPSSVGSAASREVWGLATGQFYQVTIAMRSPNYWDENRGVGNLHYMFMLKGCVNSENPNGFLNEFFKDELSKHRKVLEVLGGQMAVESSEEQLSGLGFSSTKKDHLMCKVTGNLNRTFKVIIDSVE